MAAPPFCQQTRDAFAGLIQKPQLSDKLLSKPPFRFLHDVVTATLRASGALPGVFGADELDANLVVDKQKKLDFLQKLVDAVERGGGARVDVKPAKVVAGQEPDKTNALLQAFAALARSAAQPTENGSAGDAAESKPDSGGSAGSNKENREEPAKPAADAERRTKHSSSDSKEKSRHKDKEKSSSKADRSKESSEKKRTPSEKREKSDKKTSEKGEKRPDDSAKKSSSKDEKRSSKSSEKPKTEKPDKKKRDDLAAEKPAATEKKSSRSREKEKTSSKERTRRKETEKTETKVAAAEPTKETADVANERLTAATVTHTGEASEERRLSNHHVEASADHADAVESSSTAATIGFDSHAAAAADARDEAKVPKVVRPATAMSRPGTAMSRPAPPRLKRKELGQVDTPAARLDTSEAAASVHVIADAADAAADEADAFLLEEEAAAGDEAAAPQSQGVDADELVADEHGALVRKILETKKELETGLADAESKAVTVVYDEREREKTRKETAKLQELIQRLTRNTQPLGRLLDYLQEDIDGVVKETEQWRQEYKQNAARLQQARLAPNPGAEHVRSRLNEVDARIGEARDAIAATRGKIFANETQLHNLVSSIVR